jgi:hypothetical protein
MERKGGKRKSGGKEAGGREWRAGFMRMEVEEAKGS